MEQNALSKEGLSVLIFSSRFAPFL